MASSTLHNLDYLNVVIMIIPSYTFLLVNESEQVEILTYRQQFTASLPNILLTIEVEEAAATLI